MAKKQEEEEEETGEREKEKEDEEEGEEKEKEEEDDLERERKKKDEVRKREKEKEEEEREKEEEKEKRQKRRQEEEDEEKEEQEEGGSALRFLVAEMMAAPRNPAARGYIIIAFRPETTSSPSIVAACSRYLCINYNSLLSLNDCRIHCPFASACVSTYFTTGIIQLGKSGVLEQPSALVAVARQRLASRRRGLGSRAYRAVRSGCELHGELSATQSGSPQPAG